MCDFAALITSLVFFFSHDDDDDADRDNDQLTHLSSEFNHSDAVSSSCLSQAKYRVRCQQPLCVASGARVNIQPDPAAPSGQAVWAGSSAGGEIRFTVKSCY